MNAQEFGLKPGQDLFEGEYRTKMHELMRQGLTPWSTEDIMDARNEVPVEHPRWNNYVDTDFGIAGSNSNLYLMSHSERLRAITPQTRLTYGGLHLDRKVAAKTTYNRCDLILGRDLTEEEARFSQAWIKFADGDLNRLDQYVENTFRFGKDKFGYGTMMGIFVPEDKVERAVVLGDLGGKSRALGGSRLYNRSRLIGVRG